MRKQDFRLCENKGADQMCSNCKVLLISTLFSIKGIVQFLLYYPKFQDSSFHLLVLASLCRTWSEIPKNGFSRSELMISKT